MAHKASSTLEWYLAPRAFTFGWLTKDLLRWKAPRLEWHRPPEYFALGWLTKGLRHWNAPFSSQCDLPFRLCLATSG